MPDVRQFWTPRARVIFTWAGLDRLVLSFDAMRFVVPSREETSKEPQPRTPWTHEGLRRKDGALVPGTIVVEDITDTTEEGGYKQRLSIDLMCRFLQRDRADLFARGFNVVPDGENVLGLVHDAIQLGIPLWESSQDARAREILATELERQKRHTDKGQVAPPSSSAHLVEWAVQHLSTRPALAPKYAASDITAVLEGKGLASLPTPAPAGPAPAFDGPNAPDAATVSLYEEAEAVGVKLSMTELKGLLKNDPDAVAVVAAKVQGRRADLEKEKQQDEAEAKQALV